MNKHTRALIAFEIGFATLAGFFWVLAATVAPGAANPAIAFTFWTILVPIVAMAERWVEKGD